MICETMAGDNRFEIIAKAKQAILEGTNIDTSEDEMKVLDNFLFRCWQMGWLDKYDDTKTPTESTNTPTGIPTDLIGRRDAIDALGEEPEIWNDTEEEWTYRNAWVEHISAIKALPSADRPKNMIHIDEVYRLIAGHSNYHGDSILSAFTCLVEGKDVKPIAPLDESAEPELIMCKDCKYFDRHTDTIEMYQTDGFCMDWARDTYEDWYCSRAEPCREDGEEYELATEQMEHDAMYEPTYNSEDGSM